MSDAHDFLTERLATGARTDPWAFAGRADEVTYLLQLSKSLPPEGKRSQTVLLQGAPGSGKTSLMTHVARLMDRDADAATGTHLILSPPRRWQQVDEVYGHVATMLADAPRLWALRRPSTPARLGQVLLDSAANTPAPGPPPRSPSPVRPR